MHSVVSRISRKSAPGGLCSGGADGSRPAVLCAGPANTIPSEGMRRPHSPGCTGITGAAGKNGRENAEPFTILFRGSAPFLRMRGRSGAAFVRNDRLRGTGTWARCLRRKRRSIRLRRLFVCAGTLPGCRTEGDAMPQGKAPGRPTSPGEAGRRGAFLGRAHSSASRSFSRAPFSMRET